MLSESARLLISAYAAGDLAPRRREVVERLLRQSAEARELLRELQANARLLRSLPQRPAPVDFTDRVLRALPDEQPIIRLDAVRRHSAVRHSPVARVVAAAVMIAGTIGTALILSLPSEPDNPNRDLTRETPEQGEAVAVRTPRPDAVQPGEDELTFPPDDPAPVPSAVVKSAPGTTPPSPTPSRPVARPADVLGNRPLATPDLVQVSPPRLMTLPLRGLGSATASKLRQEFAKGDAHRVDLFTRDPAKAVERMRVVCKGLGVRLLVDPTAQEALKQKVPTSFIFQCDDLTGVQWERVLRFLGTADKRAEDNRAGDGIFFQLVLMPLLAGDQKDLVTLLGTDPSANRPKPAVSSDGHRNGPGGGAPEKVALLLPFAPPNGVTRALQLSREMKQYVDGRHEQTPGAIAVMLVLRLPNP
jgi:anti-sigma factor RsiW